MPTEAQIRKLDRAIAKGEERDVVAEVTTLADEDRLLQQLLARKGSGTGWHLASNDPLHRLEIKNRHWCGLARKLSAEMPLLHQIFRYGGMEWWSSRTLLDLTDEELDSAYIYRDKYEAAVAAGKAPARPIRMTEPHEEPSSGEMYQIAMALKEGLVDIPLMDPLRRLAGILFTAIKDGHGAAKAIEYAFRDAPGTEAQTLTALEIYVPEVARLVLWLNGRKAA